MITFEPFEKIPRLNRSMVVTEKIDGANAGIIIVEETSENAVALATDGSYSDSIGVVIGAKLSMLPGEASNGRRFLVAAQSRKRLITPGKTTDLAGFADWVYSNAPALAELLGPGRHFGEWYGLGIQRGYGLDHKRFALYNSDRWNETFNVGTQGKSIPMFLGEHAIHSVPVLHRGPFNTHVVNNIVSALRAVGSYIPGAERQPAEGVVVWHNAARQMFKVTTQGDERPKGSQELA